MKEHNDKNTEKAKNDEDTAKEGNKTTSDSSDNGTVDEDDVDDPVNTYLRNMRNGFKRVNPTTAAEPNSQRKPTESCPPPPKNTSNKQSTAGVPGASRNNVEAKSNNRGKRYCHFWNNAGGCTFRNCIFEHEKAPLCNYDGKCNRKKCMFSHVKQDMTFLENGPHSPSYPAGPFPPQQGWPAMPPPFWGAPPAPWAQQWGNPWESMGMGNSRNYY